MDDLGDLAWKSMGLAAKPAPRAGNTPLNQLSGTGSQPTSGTSTPHGRNTPQSYSPSHSGANTPRMAPATPFTAPGGSMMQPLAGGTLGKTNFSSQNQPRSRATSAQPFGAATPSASSGDAFGNLVSFGQGKQNLGNMTMDQQRKVNEQQRLHQQQQQQAAQNKPSPAASAGGTPFDFGFAGSAFQDPPPKTASPGTSNTFGKQSFSPAQTPAGGLPPGAMMQAGLRPTVLSPHNQPNSQLPSGGDQWNLDFFSGAASSPALSQGSGAGDPHDPFDIAGLSAKQAQVPGQTKTSQGHDDNPLGLLAQPVQPKPAVADKPSLPSRPAASSGRSSPAPPNVTSSDGAIAQLMDMGFSDESAKNALAASGDDLSSAIELLVQNRAAEEESGRRARAASADQLGKSQDSSPRPRNHRVDKFRDDYEDESSDSDYSAARAKNSTGGYEHARSSSSRSDRAAVAQEKVIQTASAIGTSVFKNAKTLLSYSKQKISAAVELAQAEMDKASTGGARGPSERQYREREDSRERSYRETGSNEERGGFRDDSGSSSDEELSHRAQASRPAPSTAGTYTQPPKAAAAPPNDLFSFQDEEMTHSPARNFSPSTAQPSQSPRAVATAPKPPPPVKPTVTATQQQLQESSHHKEAGNVHFKAGQFGDAEASYTLSITSLPANHALLLPLFNNRAAARIKNGHYREAAEDCTAVQELDPRDVKSLLRRATAWEALEKWDSARDDYKLVMAIDPTVKAASDGMGRCQKALRPSPPAGSAPVSNASSVSSPPAAAAPKASLFAAFEEPLQKQMDPSVAHAVNTAVQKLRDQNVSAENDENERVAFKDQTDDLINRWRRGKEDNLRALLSSLDLVLWPELKWTSINLSELITPQQVKIRYMKAVGRVHPDKLAQDSTVQHRMIANSVFGTLNKGWDAFKTQNGLK
ncbi:hypothetical protein HKX48_008695 [Thoreauomyces humboldtii]|nr:hypothetical protein HKX48_008695 [Thoreauomyces humboldtii]